MDISEKINKIKSHPDYGKVGMILCHNGVVRETTRDGQAVTGLRVAVDQDRLDQLIARQKEKKGIVEVLVEVAADRDLAIGEDIMHIVVAGDIRENVIDTLSDTLNQVKAGLTSKKQYFK